MVSGGPMVPLAWPARRDSDVMGYAGDPTVDDIGFVAEFDRRTTIKIFVRTVLKPLVELLPASQVVCLRPLIQYRCQLEALMSLAKATQWFNKPLSLPKPCKRLAKALQTPCQSLAKALPKPCQSLAKALQKSCKRLVSRCGMASSDTDFGRCVSSRGSWAGLF